MTSARKKAAEDWALPATQERSRATRSRLLDAAETVFARKGYDGARLADIAKEAGCSVGAVYFRFADKSALFSAIAQAFIEDARAGLPLFSGATGHPETLVRAFVAATAANFRKHHGLFRAIVERGMEHPEAMRMIFRFREELAHTLEAALFPATRRRAPSLKIRVMTQMVYGFLLAGVLNREAPTRLDDARTVEALADACAAYLQYAPRPG